jgi:hypothetical protein
MVREYPREKKGTNHPVSCTLIIMALIHAWEWSPHDQNTSHWALPLNTVIMVIKPQQNLWKRQTLKPSRYLHVLTCSHHNALIPHLNKTVHLAGWWETQDPITTAIQPSANPSSEAEWPRWTAGVSDIWIKLAQNNRTTQLTQTTALP